MADTYGATQLPPPEVAGQRLGDPILYYLGSFLQTVANARLGDAWRSVAAADDVGPVREVFQDDPTAIDTPVEDNALPAIFIWRGELTDSIQLAEDIRIQRWVLNVTWVAAPAQAETWLAQMPFWQTLMKQWDAAINLGRDPSWIVPGDTYFFPQRRGSSLAYWAKYRRLYPQRGKPVPLVVKSIDGGPPAPALNAYSWPLMLEETLKPDSAQRFSPLKGVRGTIVSEQDPANPVQTAAFEFDTKT